MAKKASELDFVFDDENSLVLDLDENEEVEQEEADDDLEDGSEEEESLEDDSGAGTGGEDDTDVASRLDKVEQALAGLPNTIAAAITAAMGASPKAKEEPEEEEEELDIVQNPKAFLKLIEKRVSKTIDSRMDSKLKQHEPSLKQAGLNAEFQNAAAKYGDPFVKRMPMVAKVLLRSQDANGNATISVEKAYGIVRQVLNDINPQTKKKTVMTKEELVKKTKATQSDADSAESIASARTKVRDFKGKSDSEVFDAAFSSGVNRALKGRKLS